MTDTQEYCCASGVCCNEEKQVEALTQVLVTRAHLSAADARSAAEVMMRSFDLLPKAAGFGQVQKYIQAHPYR